MALPIAALLGLASAGMGLFGAGASKDRNIQQTNYNPGQEQSLQQLIQLISGGSGAYNQAEQANNQYLDPNSQAYQNWEQPYLDEYNQETIPGLAERFAGMGAMGGGLSSSGFGQALGASGANLQNKLAQLKSQLQMGASQNVFNQQNQLSDQVLRARPFENQYQKGSTGFAGGALSGLIGGLGQGTGLNLASQFLNFNKPGAGATQAGQTIPWGGGFLK